ncbi:MAG: 23S rRNA (uracil(1939)-C(5))-methyltransferase RlmD [Stomatobaculum sp.]
MKKGEIAAGIIGDTAFPDRGYIEREDGSVMIKHAIPGREVVYRITKRRGARAEGTVLRVLKPAENETAESPCIHAGSCGGCLYQTLPYAAQLAIKERQLKELLKNAAGDAFRWEGLLPSPMEQGYRMKMEYTFGDACRGGPLSLGMHRRESHYDIVTTEHCRLVHPDFNQVLETTLQYFSEREVPFYHKLRRSGYLRHLLVRRGTHSGEMLVDLVTVSAEGENRGIRPEDVEALLTGWRDALLALPLAGRLVGILHTVNDSVADAVLDQGTELLHGRDYFEETLSGLRFKITPFSFFQNNADGAELLYGKVGEYVGETGGKTVFDLYSGTGTIAQLVAETAEQAVGVEIVEEAVIAAQENAARNGIRNCSFIAGDVLKVLDSLAEKPDIIILDPPREGVNPKALTKLLRYQVNKIIYVSCKPSSLRRDLEILREGGYEVERACGVDMFPQTSNVEAVVLLSKGEVDSKRDMQEAFQKGYEADYGKTTNIIGRKPTLKDL